MKKLSLFFVGLLLSISMYAVPSGADCATAIPFTNTHSCINNNVQNGSEMWFSFTADNVSMSIQSTLTATSFGHLHRLELYKGTCTALVLVNQMNVDVLNDNIIYLPENNLTVGETYYIKAVRLLTGCNTKCAFNPAFFNLCLGVLSNTDAYCGENPGPLPYPDCDLICGGDFNANWHCPDATGEINVTYCWNIAEEQYDSVNNPGMYLCFGPNNGTPDYFNDNFCPSATYTHPNADVPFNFAGTENSHATGLGYAGFFTYDKGDITLPSFFDPTDPGYNTREYIQQYFKAPMIVGKKYHISMYLSLSDSSAMATYVGALFSTFGYDQVSSLYINKTPQIETPTIITNKLGWTLFETDFVADSAYNWIVIGNFRPEGSSNMTIVDSSIYITNIQIGFPIHRDKIGYYYIDDVAINPVDSIHTLASDTIICDGSTVTLQTGLSITQPLVYSWTSSPIDTSLAAQDSVALITVNPHDTTLYYIAITDIYGCVYHDTVKITVIPSPAEPIIVGDTIACNVTTASLYTVTNYDPSVTYTVLVASSTPPLFSSVSSLGIFYVSWATTDGGTITVIATNALGCSDTTTLEVHPCCVAVGYDTFFNPNASAMIAFYGTGSTLTNRNFSINGTLTMDVSMTWTGCKVKLGADAVIDILNGKTLSLTKSATSVTYLSACYQMWDKIKIQPLGRLIADKNTLIEDAKTAVYSIAGGKYTLNAIRLNRNYVDIALTPFTGTHTGTVQGTNFTCQSIVSGTPPTLNYPYLGYRTNIGIDINSVTSVTIGVVGTANINKFENMNTGIQMVKSSAVVINNKFQFMDGAVSPNIGIAAINATGQKLSPSKTLIVGNGTVTGFNLMSDCTNGIITDRNMSVVVNYNDIKNVTEKGIYIKNSNNINTVNILNNNLIDCYTGIFCEQNHYCTTDIRLNVIKTPALTIGTTGVAITDINSTNAIYTLFDNVIDKVIIGINAKSVSKATINNNYVTVRPAGGFFGNAIMISNNVLTKVTNNIVKSLPLSTSTFVQGIVIQDSPNTLVKCNDVNNCGASIHFDGASTTPGTLYNNIMKNATYGLWLTNAVVLGDQGGPSPIGVASDNRWLGSMTQSTFTSGSLVTVGNNSKVFYRNTGTYVPNTNSFSGSGIAMTPQFLTPTNFASICSYVLPSTFGHKAMLRVTNDSLYTIPQLKWLSKHAVYRELLADSTLIEGDTALIHFKNTSALQNMGKLYNALKVAGESNVPNYTIAQSSINALSIIDPIENYLKIVTTIILNNETLGTAYSTGDLTTLRNIAGMCPYTEGTAVYLARSLVMPYDLGGTEYENACEVLLDGRTMLANTNSETEEVTIENETAFLLYPNPNNGSMMLNYAINATDNAMLFIYDVTGRAINNYKLDASANTLSIKENELVNGIYLYKVLINGKVVKTDRLIIIK
jgi:Secretion system C-terminal sorting domain